MNRCLAGLALCLAAPAALCAQGPNRRGDPADSAAVVAIVESGRGAGPLLCELAGRTVEGQWGGGFGLEIRAPRDPLIRQALDATRRRTPDSVVPVLAAALRDDDACVRRLAAPILGRARSPAAHAALRSALQDDRPATREAAATGLGFTNDAAVIPALLAGLQDTVARVRAVCAWALGEIEDARAVGALIRLLRDDRDAEVRAAAAWALGSIEG